MKNLNPNTENSPEWLTPPEIIKACGEFDIDPCSPIIRPWDTAKKHYTIKDDGLSKEWHGRVWLTYDAESCILASCNCKCHIQQPKNAQSAGKNCRLVPSISLQDMTDRLDLLRDANGVLPKMIKPEKPLSENTDREKGDSTRKRECNDAQDAEKSLRPQAKISESVKNAAMGSLHGAKDVQENIQSSTGASCERLREQTGELLLKRKSIALQKKGKLQSGDRACVATTSADKECFPCHLTGVIDNGKNANEGGSIDALVAEKVKNLLKNISYRSLLRIAPELSQQTCCHSAKDATTADERQEEQHSEKSSPTLRACSRCRCNLSVSLIPRIWLNPPYGNETFKWVKKLADHGSGIALIFARTETKGFHAQVWRRAHSLLFLKGRLKFYRPNGEIGKAGAGAPSVLVSYSKYDTECLRDSGLDGCLVTVD